MRRRRTFLERLNFLDDVLPGRSLLELYGKNRLLIEHHRGILEFSAECIRVLIPSGQIRIVGENMLFCRIGCNHLIITGNIREIRLEDN